jgi:invasion protein IalB
MRITNTLLFLFFVSSLMFVSLSARSQEQKQTGVGGPADPDTLHFEDWAVRCEQLDDVPQKTCILFQRVAMDGGQTVLSVTVAYPANSENAAIVFRLPLGIFLPAGALLQIDEENRIKLVVQRCDQRGCWAPLKLDDDTVGLFKKGREARVAFKDTAGKTIAVPLSLKGFTAGFDEIHKQKNNQLP